MEDNQAIEKGHFVTAIIIGSDGEACEGVVKEIGKGEMVLITPHGEQNCRRAFAGHVVVLSPMRSFVEGVKRQLELGE